ncbi:hypothetical protein HYH03_007019 [Edaphochlamys debaryana]|uniref:Guanylate cyclase domain-containing protein n=1 Tax=Edaphochlamys debaryana TaxID=47281 RepID=A0A835Y2J9_9CHLO|nr:hypothetical protein HYH03_007019 [Edaphochlamys debaryana]|eukprot:KAG2494775.1 hypothetical protein HYH03_007019 [Edaphochlamys debaryana]
MAWEERGPCGALAVALLLLALAATVYADHSSDIAFEETCKSVFLSPIHYSCLDPATRGPPPNGSALSGALYSLPTRTLLGALFQFCSPFALTRPNQFLLPPTTVGSVIVNGAGVLDVAFAGFPQRISNNFTRPVSLDALEDELLAFAGRWRAGAAGGGVMYDVYQMPYSAVQDLRSAGALAGLAGLSSLDTHFLRRDVHPAILDLVTTADDMVAVPLDGSQLVLFARTDVLAALGLGGRPPESWEQLLEVAARANGTETSMLVRSVNASGGVSYNRTTGPLYGFCMQQSSHSLEELALAVLAPVVQTQGSRSGMYLDIDTLRPAAATTAMSYVLSYIRRLAAFAAPVSFSATAPPFSDDFALGRCAMALGSAAQFRRNSHAAHPAGPSAVRGRVAASLLPGSELVLGSGPAGEGLVRCTPELCPYAALVSPLPGTTGAAPPAASQLRRLQQGAQPQPQAQQAVAGPVLANRAPLLSPSGLVGGIAPSAEVMAQLYSWLLLSSIGGPTNSWGLLLQPSSEVGPWRIDHFAAGPGRWAAAGYDGADAASFLTAARASLDHPNVVWPLRIRGAVAHNRAVRSAAWSLLNATAAGQQQDAAALDAAQASIATKLTAAVLALYGGGRYGSTIDGGSAAASFDGAQSNLYVDYRRSFGYKVAVVEPAPAPAPQSSEGPPVGVIVGSVVGGTVVLLLAALLAHRTLRRGGQRSLRSSQRWRVVAPPGASPDTVLLVTDIEGSTTLWESLPEAAMDAALRTHHATVRTVGVLWGAYESATEGDSFVLAFSSAPAAAQFALGLQRALLAASWPHELLAVPACAPVYIRRQEAVARAAGVSLAVPPAPRLLGAVPRAAAALTRAPRIHRGNGAASAASAAARHRLHGRQGAVLGSLIPGAKAAGRRDEAVAALMEAAAAVAAAAAEAAADAEADAELDADVAAGPDAMALPVRPEIRCELSEMPAPVSGDQVTTPSKRRWLPRGFLGSMGPGPGPGAGLGPDSGRGLAAAAMSPSSIRRRSETALLGAASLFTRPSPSYQAREPVERRCQGRSSDGGGPAGAAASARGAGNAPPARRMGRRASLLDGVAAAAAAAVATTGWVQRGGLSRHLATVDAAPGDQVWDAAHPGAPPLPLGASPAQIYRQDSYSQGLASPEGPHSDQNAVSSRRHARGSAATLTTVAVTSVAAATGAAACTSGTVLAPGASSPNSNPGRLRRASQVLTNWLGLGSTGSPGPPVTLHSPEAYTTRTPNDTASGTFGSNASERRRQSRLLGVGRLSIGFGAGSAGAGATQPGGSHGAGVVGGGGTGGGLRHSTLVAWLSGAGGADNEDQAQRPSPVRGRAAQFLAQLQGAANDSHPAAAAYAPAGGSSRSRPAARRLPMRRASALGPPGSSLAAPAAAAAAGVQRGAGSFSLIRGAQAARVGRRFSAVTERLALPSHLGAGAHLQPVSALHMAGGPGPAAPSGEVPIISQVMGSPVEGVPCPWGSELVPTDTAWQGSGRRRRAGQEEGGEGAGGSLGQGGSRAANDMSAIVAAAAVAAQAKMRPSDLARVFSFGPSQHVLAGYGTGSSHGSPATQTGPPTGGGDGPASHVLSAAIASPGYNLASPGKLQDRERRARSAFDNQGIRADTGGANGGAGGTGAVRHLLSHAANTVSGSMRVESRQPSPPPRHGTPSTAPQLMGSDGQANPLAGPSGQLRLSDSPGLASLRGRSGQVEDAFADSPRVSTELAGGISPLPPSYALQPPLLRQLRQQQEQRLSQEQRRSQDPWRLQEAGAKRPESAAQASEDLPPQFASPEPHWQWQQQQEKLHPHPQQQPRAGSHTRFSATLPPPLQIPSQQQGPPQPPRLAEPGRSLLRTQSAYAQEPQVRSLLGRGVSAGEQLELATSQNATHLTSTTSTQPQLNDSFSGNLPAAAATATSAGQAPVGYPSIASTAGPPALASPHTSWRAHPPTVAALRALAAGPGGPPLSPAQASVAGSYAGSEAGHGAGVTMTSPMPRFVSSPTPSHAQEPTSSSAIALHRRFAELAQETMPYASVPVPASPGQEPSLLRRLPLRRGSGLSGASGAGHSSASGAGAAAAGGGSGPGAPNASVLALAGGPVQGAIRSGGSGVAAVVSSALRFRSFTRPLSRAAPSTAAAGHRAAAGGSVSGAGAGFGAGGGGATLTGGGGTGGIQTGPSSGTRSRMVVRTVNSRRALMEPLAEEATTMTKVESPESASPTLTDTTRQAPARARNIRRSRTFTSGPDRTAQGPPARPSTPHATGRGGGDTEAGDSRYSQASGGAYGTGTASMYGGTGAGGGTGGGLGSVSISGLLPTALAAIRDAFSGVSSGRRALAGFAGGESSLRGEGSALARGQSGLDSNASVVLDPSRRGAATPPLLSSAVEVGSLLEIQPDPGSEAGARDTHAVPLPLQPPPPPPLMSYARLSYPTSPLPDDRPSPLTAASPADAMMSGAVMSGGGGGAGVTALDAATLAVFPYPLPQLSAPEVSMALAPPPQPRPSAVAMGHTAHRRPPMPGSLLELLHRVFLRVPDFPDPPPPDCLLVFAGLRVRVGLHSGVQAKDITYNPATARVTYSGDSLRTAKCVCDCASGGQVIMSGEVLLRLQLAMPGGGGVLMLQLQAHIMDLGDHQLLDSVPLHLAAPPPPLPPPTYGPAASLPTGPSKVAEPVPAIAVPVSRHLLQLAPPGLLGRLSFMPPVRSAIHQYTPGFMDAPVGDSVAVVVFRVSHASALLAWNAAVAAESMALLELYLRASLGPLLPTAAAAGPHEVRPHTAPGASTAPSNDGTVTSPGAVDAGAPSGTPCYLAAAPPGSPFGTFVAGFNETAAAARWALQAAARMADLPWPEQLLETPWGRPLEEVSQAEAEAADAAPTGGPTAGFVGALLARGMGAVGGGGSEISTRQHGGSASGAASPQLRPGNGRLGLSSPVRTSPFLRLKRTVTAHVAPSSAGLPLKLPAPPTSSGQSFTGSLWTAGPSLELKPQSDPHLLGSGSAPGPGATGLVHAGGGAPDEPGATSGSGPYGGRISCGEPRGSNGPLAVGSGSGSVMRGMFTGQRGDSRSPMQRSPHGVGPRTGSSAEPLSLPSRLASPPPPSLAASLRAIAPVAATLEESDRVSYSLAFMPMSVRQSVDPASMSFALDRHEMCLASGTHSLDPVGTFLQDSQTGLPRSGSVQITSPGPPARSARLVPHLNIHARSTSHIGTGHTTPSPSPAALRHTAATDSDTLPDALGCARSTANATAVLTSLATVNAAALDHTSEQEAEQSPGETASPARDGPGRLSAGSRAIRPGSAALPYSSSGRMAEPSSRNASGPHRRLKARLRQLTLSFTSLAQRRGGGGGSGSPLALKASDRAMSTHTASSLSVGRAASGPRLGPSHLRTSAGETRGGGVPSGLRTGPSLLGPPPGRTSGSGTTGPGMLMGTQQTIELKEDAEVVTLRGLRVRLGLAVGAVRVELCPMTGRVVYSGKTVTAAMTAAAAARLGALYATQAAAEAIVCSQGGQGMASTHPHQQATPSSRPDQLHSNGAATADGGEGRTSGGSQKARPASGVSQRRGRLAGLARALGEDGGFRRGGRASAQTASQLVLSEGGDRTPKQASLSGTPRHRSSYNGAGSGALPRIQDEPSHRGSDPGAATLIVGSADGTAPGPASAAFLRVGGGALASGAGRGMGSRRGGMGSGLGYGPVGTGRPSDPGVGSGVSGMGLGGVAPFLGATVAFDRASPLLEEPPPAEVQQQQQPTQTHDKSQPEGVTAGDAADESAQGSQLPPPTMLLCSRAAGPVAAFNAGAGISLPLTNPKAPYVIRLVPATTLPSPPPAQPSAAAQG